MKPALTKIFVTLGILFVFLVLGGVYFYVTDPMNLKPMLFGSDSTETKNDNTKPVVAGGFQLSESQKQALVSAGMDPSKVPSSISATQETCFMNALGNARVVEIKGGAVPSGVEFLKSKSCI